MSNSCMPKHFALFPHQKKALEHIQHQQRLLIIRPLGTGKTLIALEALCNFTSQTMEGLYIVPAHLIEQVRQQAESWGYLENLGLISLNNCPDSKSRVVLTSFDLFRRYASKILNTKWKIVVVDEFHRAKGMDTKTNILLFSLAQKVPKFIGLTGTPLNNHPYEFFRLLSIIAGKNLIHSLEHLLLRREKHIAIKGWVGLLQKFLYTFIPQKRYGAILGIHDAEKFKQIVLPLVDYMNDSQVRYECGMPTVDEKVIYCTLTQQEWEKYRKLALKFRRRDDHLFFNDNLPDEKIESAFSRLIKIRQFLLGEEGEPSSKSNAISEWLKEVASSSNTHTLIFTNFLTKGADILVKSIKMKGITCARFSGNESKVIRQKLLAEFRKGVIRVLVLTPVGYEGLDLRETTHIGIADPHYNPEKMRQAIARATRAGSGIEYVQVRHFISVSPEEKQETIDQVILRISYRKDTLNNTIRNILNQSNF